MYIILYKYLIVHILNRLILYNKGITDEEITTLMKILDTSTSSTSDPVIISKVAQLSSKLQTFNLNIYI